MNGHLEIVQCVNQHLNASFNNLCTTTSSIVQINRISPMIMTCFLYIHHPPQLAIVYRKYIIPNGWWSKLLLHSHWNGHQEDGWVSYNVIGMGSWDGTVSLDPCPSIMRVTGKYWPFKLWFPPPPPSGRHPVSILGEWSLDRGDIDLVSSIKIIHSNPGGHWNSARVHRTIHVSNVWQ